MSDPTSSDLLALAREEQDPTVRIALLRKAEEAALAGTLVAQDLLSVATVHADDARDDAARRCVDSAIARADGAIWVYRNSANLRLRLGDDEDAREALLMCESAFAERSTAGYEWRLLAQGWVDDLGDSSGAVRCLARATVGAKSVDDHCSVADGLCALVGDREGAYEALERARLVAESGDDRHAWWTIANTFAGIGDGSGTRRALEWGAAAAQTLEAHLVMAAAWQSHFPGGGDVTRCLNAGSAVAVSSADWLSIAEAHADYDGAAAAIRSCLESALAVVGDESDRRRIAGGFRLWLGDRARADVIAPVGVPPDDVASSSVPLPGWEANAAALLDYLREQTTPQILASIANADYGMDADKNLAILDDIVQTGLVPHPLDWNPLEVLHLTRWGQGVRVNHVERAFACTLLCIEATDVNSEASEADIAILLESCTILGPRALAVLVPLFVALVEGTTWTDVPEERWNPAVFALLLAAGSVDPADARLEELAALVDAEGLRYLFNEGMRPELWRQLAVEILPMIAAAQPKAANLQTLLTQIR